MSVYISKHNLFAEATRTGRRVVDSAFGSICAPSCEGEARTHVEVKQRGKWVEQHVALARVLTNRLWRGGQFAQLPNGRWLYVQSVTCQLLIAQSIDIDTLRRCMEGAI